jgi:hypothetical protein
MLNARLRVPAANPSLFDPGPPKLTDRQAFLLERVRLSEDGLAADEAGALLHERRGKHDAGVRCEWCSTEGKGRTLGETVIPQMERGMLALGPGVEDGEWSEA